MANYYTRTLSNAEKSELWKTYGFTLKYTNGGSGDFASKVGDPTLRGIYSEDFSISTGANLMTSESAKLINEGTRAIKDVVIDKIAGRLSSKFKPIAEMIKRETSQRMGKSIAESIKIYDNGNGRPNININAFFIPGLFGFKSYEHLEKFATYATLPKKKISEKQGFTQHIYNPAKAGVAGFIDFSSDLFAIKINNLINIPGGMYITNFVRQYSNDKDENGKPIFCRASITMEYYREMFADEFVKLFSEF